MIASLLRNIFLAVIFLAVVPGQGRLAHAQQINKLVMPGSLAGAHADIEAQCDSCHSNSDSITQTQHCLNCHTEIAENREANSGFHGRFETAARNECVTCHTDHEGRDFDIGGLSRGLFDHGSSEFPLAGAHSTAECGSCHQADKPYSQASTACVDCHSNDDIHGGGLGPECGSCHNDQVFDQVKFDHDEFGFELSNGHSDLSCHNCHSTNDFASASRSCASCHAVDDVHKGSKGRQCAQCHNTSTWAGIDFNHLQKTGFALNGQHSGLVCEACHKRKDYTGESSQCVACHASDDTHQQQFGKDCQSCHVESDWTETRFDHAETGFTLEQAHAALPCQSCHDQSGPSTLSSDCGACHVADDVHGGQLGTSCQSCHSQTDWRGELSFDHDLVSFPLIGLHASAACSSCHASAQFKTVEKQCVDCHLQRDVHEGALGDQCQSCHNPTAWSAWEFDHALTNFPLSGGHADVSCGACHSDANGQTREVSSQCVDCHRSDDPHEGQFGRHCQSCHNDENFAEIKR